jgi:hypothetical protein
LAQKFSAGKKYWRQVATSRSFLFYFCNEEVLLVQKKPSVTLLRILRRVTDGFLMKYDIDIHSLQ